MEIETRNETIDGQEVFVLDMTRGLGDESKWNIQAETGYEPKTTFYQDFAIADAYGPTAVEATCLRAFREWKDNVQFLAELVMVLNHRGWMHYHKKRMGYANVYFSLYEALNDWCYEHLTGDDLDYYVQTLD